MTTKPSISLDFPEQTPGILHITSPCAEAWIPLHQISVVYLDLTRGVQPPPVMICGGDKTLFEFRGDTVGGSRAAATTIVSALSTYWAKGR